MTFKTIVVVVMLLIVVVAFATGEPTRTIIDHLPIELSIDGMKK